MKKKHRRSVVRILGALLLSLLLCIPAGLAFFYFTQPTEDVSYDLSLLAEDGQEYQGDKGWTVYIDEAGERTPLTSNGTGGYSGLTEPGQTFYYSRKLTERLDSPMLQIGVANRTVAVFLDDDVIYTDCPDMDNRIGYLALPMLEADRFEPLTVSLPPDYPGRTLTIAQSTPIYSETSTEADPSFSETVWPCDITLYCGYAYESGLIAEASRVMLPAVLLSALMLLLLAVFVWNAWMGKLYPQLPVFVLALLFQIGSILSGAEFFSSYFGILPVDLRQLFFHLSAGALFLFLTLYSGRLLLLSAAVTALHWTATVLYFLVQMDWLMEYGTLYVFLSELPQYTGFFGLLLFLAEGFLLWKRGSRFFRRMCTAALTTAAGYGIFLLCTLFLRPGYAADVFKRLKDEAATRLPYFSLQLVWDLCLIAALVSVIMEVVSQMTEYFTENAVLTTKNKLALESYENLRRQSEEIQMLRHDTMKHYSLLYAMSKEQPEQISGYLKDLIGQARDIRPVVASRNRVLDILVNGKLSEAAEKGISVEILRSDAPERLPHLFDPMLADRNDPSAGKLKAGALQSPHIAAVYQKALVAPYKAVA